MIDNSSQPTLLRRDLGRFSVWALAFGCIIGWGAFVMPGNTFLMKAGPLGTAIAMGLATIVMILIAVNYQFMIRKYPVSGGEFTYADVAFGRRHAFACSWFLGLSYLAVVPLNATALALIGRNLLSGIFQFGFHYTVAGYDIYFGELLLAFGALSFFCWLSIRGAKATGIFQTILAISLAGGVLVIALAAVFSQTVSFDSLKPNFPPEVTKCSGVLAVLAVAPWAFVGFDTVPQAAEEFRFQPGKARGIMILSILFGGFVYVALNTVTAVAIPSDYATWNAYIADLPNLNGLASLPTFHAAYLLLGKVGLVFIGIAVLAAILSGILGFYMATSRLLYSMARQAVLPKWFAVVSNRSGTPRNAILFVMAISFLAPFFGRTALGWVVDMSSVGAAVGFGYTSAAALKLALKEKNAAVAVTGFIGMLISCAFVVLLLIPIKGLDCSLGKESFIALAVWMLLGLVFHIYSVKNESYKS